MAYGDPWPRYPHGQPIWIDPRFYQPERWGQQPQNHGWVWTETTNVTRPYTPPAPVQPLDEERIRKLVREEIADLPIPFDVPDAPPETP